MKVAHLKDVLTKSKDGKLIVNAQVAIIYALPEQHLAVGTELLLDYGRKFWTSGEDEHCVHCFSRSESVGNPLILCDGRGVDGEMCSVGRHRFCLPANHIPSADDLESTNFYCSNHLPQAHQQLPSTPRRQRSQVPDAWTPPPTTYSPFSASPSATALPVLGEDESAMIQSSSSSVALQSQKDHGQPRLALASPAVRSISFGSSSLISRSVVRSLQTDTLSCIDYRSEHESEGVDSKESTSTDDSDAWRHSEEEHSGSSDSAARSDSDHSEADGHTHPRHRVLALADADVEAQTESIIAARERAGIAPKLSIRTKAQVQKRSSYQEVYATPTARQVAMLQQIMNRFTSRAILPWFIPKSKANAKDEVVGSAASVASAPAALSVGYATHSRELNLSHAAASVASVEQAAAAAPATAPGSGSTSNRWRDVGNDLAHDWADYKHCCGKMFNPPAGMSAFNLEEHSSHSVVKMFQARLAFLDRVTSEVAFKDLVRETLDQMEYKKVPWMGGRICLSCFRAVLGRGRGFLFTARHAPDVELRSQRADITAGGNLRKQRAAPKRDRVYELLFQYSRLHGHHLPNAKGKDLNKTRYYLSVATMQDLAEALSEYERVLRKSGETVAVAMHQLKAAKKLLAERKNIHLTLGSSISLMRCATCDQLDNRTKSEYIKTYRRSVQEQNSDKLHKQQHLATMQRQRDFFNKEKELAMQHPTKVWTITLDGMDQAKTQLPHRARFSKDLDPLPRLKVHAEGGFCFGGPRPIIGLINFADLRKDSNLCVTAVERILDIQWEELMKDHELAQKYAQEAENKRAAAAQLDPDAHQARQDAEDAAPSVASSPVYAADGLGMKWPQRIHLTFDNAPSECKNQWMFRFLGLMVLHGVVQFITVSTMLVGHTHDIVDQLFSIWARMLRIHNAETYEKMRDIFRERYISRIQGLVALMKKRKGEREAAAAAAASVELTAEEMKLFEEHQEGASAAEWHTEAGKILDNFTNFVKGSYTESELSPHIELQSVSVDVQGWLTRSMECKLPELPNLDRPHHFGIEKDENGDVWLYNKFLANSTEITGDGVRHNHRVKATGCWTSRAKLYSKGDELLADPFRIPPIGIDTKSLRDTVRKYVQQSAMTHDEADQFTQMLARLDDAQAKQRELCATCAELCAAYSGFGTIHQPRKAGEEEKRSAAKKHTAKDKAWREMLAHLYDPAFADAHHAGQRHEGWWTKWLQRAHDHIQPAYVLRGFVPDPQVLRTPYHAHPQRLVTNGDELPCMEAPGRVDGAWLIKHGVPRPGQMAIIRSDTVKEPFYVGVIRAVQGLTPAAEAELAKVKADEASHQLKEAQAAAVAAATAAAAAQPAAVTPANDPAAPAASKRAPRLGLREASLTMKQFRFTVEYWDLHPTCFSDRLHLYAEKASAKVKDTADKWWASKLQENNADLDELQRQLNAAVLEKRAPPPVPGFIVDLYKDASFIPAEEGKSYETVPGPSFVVWGPRTEIFGTGRIWEKRVEECDGKGWKIRTSIWKPVREDLTEQFLRNEAALAAGAAGVDLGRRAAAASQPLDEHDAQMHDADDQKAAVETSAAFAAAAAAAATAVGAPVSDVAQLAAARIGSKQRSGRTHVQRQRGRKRGRAAVESSQSDSEEESADEKWSGGEEEEEQTDASMASHDEQADAAPAALPKSRRGNTNAAVTRTTKASAAAVAKAGKQVSKSRRGMRA